MIDQAQTTSSKRNGPAILLLFLCSLAAVVPLLVRGPSCGHDFDFHLLSWIETAHDWHHGLLDPHWLATANYGAGEPRFIFYPPISWVLGAGLGAVAGWMLAPPLLTFIAIFGAGICVYFLALSLTTKTPAFVAACLFIANPYLLFVAYERTAYGELLATGLIALLLLFALQKTVPVISIAVVIAALWLTNAPAAVMACYMLAFVAVLRISLDRGWANLSKAASGCALGIALTAFYLVPAAVEQRWVQISRAVGPGMRVEDSFLFLHTGEAFHDQVLHTASLIAVIIFSIGFIAALVRRSKSLSAIVLASLLAFILLLQFPVSKVLWHAAPHLAFLQFPWRWLVVASIVSACLLAIALEKVAVKFQVTAALLIVFGSVWYCSQHFYQPCDDEDAVSAQLTDFQSGSGVAGTDEYTAGNGDNSAIQQHLPPVRLIADVDADEPSAGSGDNPDWSGTPPQGVAISAWEPESKSFVIHATQPGYAVVRLMDYPAWRVILNGRPVVQRPQREDGLMLIPVPAGESRMAIRWMTMPDVTWGRALSGIALVILIGVGWKRRSFTRSG